MNEIQLRATYHVTRQELSKNSIENIHRRAKGCLSGKLSHAILNKDGIFETKETEHGIRFCAECYVLTPDDFFKLVEKIQHDLTRYECAPMIGGVYTTNQTPD